MPRLRHASRGLKRGYGLRKIRGVKAKPLESSHQVCALDHGERVEPSLCYPSRAGCSSRRSAAFDIAPITLLTGSPSLNTISVGMLMIS